MYNPNHQSLIPRQNVKDLPPTDECNKHKTDWNSNYGIFENQILSPNGQLFQSQSTASDNNNNNIFFPCKSMYDFNNHLENLMDDTRNITWQEKNDWNVNTSANSCTRISNNESHLIPSSNKVWSMRDTEFDQSLSQHDYLSTSLKEIEFGNGSFLMNSEFEYNYPARQGEFDEILWNITDQFEEIPHIEIEQVCEEVKHQRYYSQNNENIHYLPEKQQPIPENNTIYQENNHCISKYIANDVSFGHPQQKGESCFLLDGDFMIDLRPLENLIKPLENSKGQCDNKCGISALSEWKRCSQVSKDHSQNGCIYVSVDFSGNLSSPARVRDRLVEIYQSIPRDFNSEFLEEFETRYRSIEEMISSIEKKSQANISSSYFEGKQQQMGEEGYCETVFKENSLLTREKCLQKAKEIMRSEVSTNGSKKSFAFGMVKSLNPQNEQHQIQLHQLIYSPKLISLLYGGSNSCDQFASQLMHKGILEFFNPSASHTFNMLELSESTNNSKIPLNLQTADGFNIPASITLRKFNLLCPSSDENIATSSDSNVLLLFSIKIKIKHQKLLKKLRNSSLVPAVIIKSIQKQSSNKLSSTIKRKPNRHYPEIPSRTNDLSSDILPKYFAQTLEFLNKFYPAQN